MNEFTRKKSVDQNLLRKQIISEARAYTDQEILRLSESISTSLINEEDELIDSETGISNPVIGDEPVYGSITSVLFMDENGDFNYDPEAYYGNLYVNPSGDYIVDVTGKAISDDTDIVDIEIQITRVTDEG